MTKLSPKKLWMALLLTASMISVEAYANNYSEDFKICAVGSMTDADKKVFAEYMIQELATQPQFARKSLYTKADKERSAKALAQALTRIMSKDCSRQLMNVFVYENEYKARQTIVEAVKTWGEYAIIDATKQIDSSKLTQYMDQQQFMKNLQDSLGVYQ